MISKAEKAAPEQVAALRAAFDFGPSRTLRLYSKSDVAVSLRILRSLGDIAGTTKDPQIHEVLLDRAKRIVAGCAEKLEEHEMTEVRARLFALQKT